MGPETKYIFSSIKRDSAILIRAGAELKYAKIKRDSA